MLTTAVLNKCSSNMDAKIIDLHVMHVLFYTRMVYVGNAGVS